MHDRLSKPRFAYQMIRNAHVNKRIDDSPKKTFTTNNLIS